MKVNTKRTWWTYDKYQSEVDEAAKLKESENGSETAMQIDLCDGGDSKEIKE